MRISRREFDRRLANNTLALTFIGMSGIGKTHNAKRLKPLGFNYVPCDDLIAVRIAGPVKLKNVTDVGFWMGQPYSRGYRDRERTYLDLEETVTREALADIRQNTVIDSTGSIVYLSRPLLRQIKDSILVVYIEAEPDIYERMLTLYHADPKPVVWGGSFKRRKGETRHDALAHSFSKLLDFRAKKYAELADVTIPAKVVYDLSGGPRHLLEVTREHLD